MSPNLVWIFSKSPNFLISLKNWKIRTFWENSDQFVQIRTQFTLKIENFKLLEKKQTKCGHISKNGPNLDKIHLKNWKKQTKFGLISKDGQNSDHCQKLKPKYIICTLKVSDDGSYIFEKVSCQSQHGFSHKSSLF